MGVWCLGHEGPLEKEMATHSSIKKRKEKRKKKSQASLSFLPLSHHFRSVWDACPGCPRKPHYVRNFSVDIKTKFGVGVHAVSVGCPQSVLWAECWDNDHHHQGCVFSCSSLLTDSDACWLACPLSCALFCYTGWVLQSSVIDLTKSEVSIINWHLEVWDQSPL